MSLAMANTNPNVTARVACPIGSAFYACESFVGCCTSNACPQACPTPNLTPMMLGNLSPDWEYRYSFTSEVLCPGTAQYYTCQDLNPTFQGCCQIDACKNNGCQGQLVAARPAAGALAEIASDPNIEYYDYTAHLSKGAIAGAVIGSVIAAALLMVGAIYCGRRHRRRTQILVEKADDQSRSRSPLPFGAAAGGFLRTSQHSNAGLAVSEPVYTTDYPNTSPAILQPPYTNDYTNNYPPIYANYTGTNSPLQSALSAFTPTVPDPNLLQPGTTPSASSSRPGLGPGIYSYTSTPVAMRAPQSWAVHPPSTAQEMDATDNELTWQDRKVPL